MEVIEIEDTPPPSPARGTSGPPQPEATVVRAGSHREQPPSSSGSLSVQQHNHDTSAHNSPEYQRVLNLMRRANKEIDNNDLQAEAINACLQYIQQSRQSDQQHLFCSMHYYPISCFCLMLFSYRDLPAPRWFKNLISPELNKCAKCVVLFNRGRAKLIQEFAAERGIPRDKIDEFQGIILDWSRERVLKKLKSEYQSYIVDPEEGIPPALSIPVWECLFAPVLLRDINDLDNNTSETLPIRTYFDEAIQLLITKEYPNIMKLSAPNPGLLFLVIEGKPMESRWAFRTLDYLYDENNLLKPQQVHPEMKEEYWFRLRKMNDLNRRTDKDVELFYRALLPFMKIFDSDAILKSFLLPMKFLTEPENQHNLFERVLDDLLVASDSSFPYVARFLTFLLTRFGSSFFTHIKPFTYHNVIDNILTCQRHIICFENIPDFELIPGDLNPEATSHDLLSWIDPLVDSLEGSSQQNAISKISHTLISIVETRNNVPLSTKAAFFKKSCILLSKGLTIKSTSYSASSFGNELLQRNDTRQSVDHKLERFLDYSLSKAIFHPEQNKAANDDIARSAMDVLCKSLRYDIMLLANQTYDAKNSRPLVACRFQSIMFEYLVKQNLNLHKELAFRILSSLDLVNLIVPVEGSDYEKQSTSSKEFLGLLSRFLLKFSDIDPYNSKLILSNQNSLKGYWACVFCSDDKVYQSAVDLLYDTFDADGRLEGFHALLQANFVGCVATVNDNISTLTFNKYFEPCPRAVKILTDIVSCFDNPINGLFDLGVMEGQGKQTVLKFWSQSWKFLDAIYKETVKWATSFTVDLVEFTRDTLDLSHAVLGCFKAIVNTEMGSLDIKDRKESLTTEIIATFTGMSVWLKLSDPGLLASCVRLISNTLDIISESELTLDDKIVELLARYASKSRKFTNKLTEPQVEEIFQRARKFNAALVEKIIAEAEEYRRSKNPSPPPDPTPTAVTSDTHQGAIARSSSVGSSSILATETTVRRGQMKLADFGSLLKRKQLVAPAPAKPTMPKSQLEIARAEIAAKSAPRVIHAARPAGFNVKRSKTKKDGDSDSDSDEGSDVESQTTRSLFGLREKKKDSGPIILETAHEINRRKMREKQKEIENTRLRLNVDLNPLYDRILKWSFRSSSDYPDSQVEASVQEVKDVFSSAKDYISTYEPLLLLECWQGIQASKIREGDRPMTCVIASKKAVNNYFEIFISMKKQEIVEYKLTESDLVVLCTRENENVKPSNREMRDSLTSCFGKIHEIKTVRGDNVDMTIRITRSSALNVSFTPNMTIMLMKLMQMTTIEREYSSLHGLEYYNLRDNILKAQPGSMPVLSPAKIQEIQKKYDVNESQANAIGCTLETVGFSLIQGPPGTGKTKTILGIIGYMLDSFKKEKAAVISVPGVTQRNTAADDIKKGKKVLVCAPSNAAVDELVLRLKDGIRNGSKDSKGADVKFFPNVVRLGRSDAVNAAVKDRTLEELVEKRVGGSNGSGHVSQMAPLRAQMDKIRKELDELQLKINADMSNSELYEQRRQLRNQNNIIKQKLDNERAQSVSDYRNREVIRRKVQAEILEGADIICSTLSGSAHEMVANLNISFDSVIIDEACQCTELSVVIPLRYGCKRCVMVGDPNQLPPTVLSEKAADLKYDQSLFVRMAKNFKPLLLNVQYRMHPAISQFPSIKFYNSELKDGPSMDKKTERPWHRDPLFPPYRFYDIIDGHQSQNTKTMSFVNYEEVDIAIELVKALFNKFRNIDFLNNIGIITPYKEQNRVLQSKFVKVFGQNIKQEITFNTVDGFQGQEKEIIIMSCVRADASKSSVGFLRDFRRMNVAFTRPKCSLWVLGHHDSLVKDSLWYDLITNAKERGCLVEARQGFTRANSETLKLIESGKSHKVEKDAAAIRDTKSKKKSKEFDPFIKKKDKNKKNKDKKKNKSRHSDSTSGDKAKETKVVDVDDDDDGYDPTIDYGATTSDLKSSMAAPVEAKPPVKKMSFQAYKSSLSKSAQPAQPDSSSNLPVPSSQGTLPQPTRSAVLPAGPSTKSSPYNIANHTPAILYGNGTSKVSGSNSKRKAEEEFTNNAKRSSVAP
ncbi:hypothetical protein WICPIJ_001795, partial [Wickerhamomyces pijperi]